MDWLLLVRRQLMVAARLLPLLPGLQTTHFACDAEARVEAAYALAGAAEKALEAAFDLAMETGLETWEVIGPRPNPLPASQPDYRTPTLTRIPIAPRPNLSPPFSFFASYTPPQAPRFAWRVWSTSCRNRSSCRPAVR